MTHTTARLHLWVRRLRYVGGNKHVSGSLSYKPKSRKNNVEILEFGQDFSQGLGQVALPPGLEALAFGGEFDQNLNNTVLPGGLQTLIKFWFNFGIDL